MFAYCNNNPINYKDINGLEPFTTILTAASVITFVVAVVGSIAISYATVNLLWTIGSWISSSFHTRISYAKDVTEPETPDVTTPEPPDVTYPGDDPEEAPEGYEWRGPDSQGGKRGGYANPEGKDSWHPDLDHPDGVDPHWDYNDGTGHKWRVFPDRIVLVK